MDNERDQFLPLNGSSNDDFLKGTTYMIFSEMVKGIKFNRPASLSCYVFEKKDSFESYVRISAAESTENKKKYVVCLSGGLLRHLYDSLYVVLSDNAIFPNFGRFDSQLFVDALKFIPGAKLGATIYDGRKLPGFDADREELHFFLFAGCVSFYLAHELAHIYHGHVDYLNEEKVQGDNRQDLSFLRQCMEIDSDNFAQNQLFPFWTSFLKLKPKYAPDRFHHINELFHAIQFVCCYSVLILPSPTDSDADIYAAGSTHPSFIARAILIVNCFMKMTLIKDREPDFQKLQPNFNLGVQMVLESLTARSAQKIDFGMMTDEKFIEYLVQLGDGTKVLATECDQFAYVKENFHTNPW